MNRKVLVALGMLVTAPALAQVRVGVDVQVPVPTIRFEVPPPLVVVSPGVRVVEDYDDEVFFSDGWYWCRREDHWFRTRDYHGGWVVVERRYVPVSLVKIPPGHYKHYKMNRAVPAGGPGWAPARGPGWAPAPGPVGPPGEGKFKHKKFKGKH
jgi:hypothetical protein